MNLKPIKGQYGYIRRKRKVYVGITVFLFALSLSIFLMGYLTTGGRRNLLTVVCVLGMLPASRSLINTIMLFRSKGCSSSLYEKIKKISKDLNVRYDMYFTSYEHNYDISAMLYHDGVLFFCSEKEIKDKKAFTDHIETMLKGASIGKKTVNLTDDTDRFLEMLSSVEKGYDKGDVPSDEDAVLSALYDICL